MTEDGGSARSAASNRREYTRRMHAVLEHIDRHLDAPLDLPTLAAVAHFSPFHFHRLFQAWMGETLGEYLRRRRLELSAMRLVAQPRLPVLQAALSVGFGSSEAYARAFKARFGLSPSAWRAREIALRRAKRNLGQVGRNPDQAAVAAAGEHGVPFPSSEDSAMHVRLIDRPPVRIAYLRHLGPYGPGIERFWQQQVGPWMQRHGLLGAPRYGISHDDPDVTAPERCRYDAAVEVLAGFVPDGGALVTVLPGGRYAALHFHGTSAEIGAAWAALLRDWLPESGLQLDGRPCFEHDPRNAGFDAGSGAFDCEICLPVSAL